MKPELAIRPSLEAAFAAQSLRMDVVAVEVTRALAERGIESVLLKGPSIAEWLYTDGSVRPYNDCDLLVSPETWDAAGETLRALGFNDYLAPLAHPRMGSHSGQAWARGNDAVDLHATLWGLGADPSQVWATLSRLTSRQRVAGEDVAVLAPAARALHVALHVVQHGVGDTDDLKTLTDLERAIALLPKDAWVEAAALAQLLSAAGTFAAGLRFLPEGARLASELGLAEARSVEALLHVTPVPLAQGFEQLWTAPGAKAKAALALREVFPTRDFMTWWSPLSRRGSLGLIAAYCWRLLWFARHAVPGFRAWWRARRLAGPPAVPPRLSSPPEPAWADGRNGGALHGSTRNEEVQALSSGRSSPQIHAAVLALADPVPGLSWLDVGCGTGDLLRAIRNSLRPSRLAGLDLIDWLADDLRRDVELTTAAAEEALPRLEQADRVLLVEILDDLEGPWSALRQAARLVAPGGTIVVTAPNISSLRNRVELVSRGDLSSFRPDNLPQRTPVLPHVVEQILVDEGLVVHGRAYAGTDVIPITGGKVWPEALRKRAESLLSISRLIVARAPDFDPAGGGRNGQRRVPRTSRAAHRALS